MIGGDNPLKNGERVVVQRYGIAEGIEFRTVRRAMKRFVELDDGSKWDPVSGCPYPWSGGYSNPTLRRERDGDREVAEREKLRKAIDFKAMQIRERVRHERFKSFDVERAQKAFALVRDALRMLGEEVSDG